MSWPRRIAVAVILAVIAIFVWRAPKSPPKASRPKAAATPTTHRPPPLIRLGSATVEKDPAVTGGSVEGRVVSATTGAGIAGAELTFAQGGAVSSVVAAADGTFRFAPSAPGVFTLQTAQKTGFLPFAPELGQSPLVFTLRAGERIRGVLVQLAPAVEYVGQVLLPDGQPAAGAEVRLLNAPTTATLPDRFASDAKGEFRFSAPDDSQLEARLGDYAPARGLVDWKVQVSHRLVMKLGPRGSAKSGPIAGRVVDGPGALVQAVSESVSLRTVADAQGRFAFTVDAGVPFRVTASLPERAPASVDGVQAGTTNLELRLGADAALTGSVRDGSGGPVVAFTVMVFAPRGIAREPVLQSQSFDAQGRYSVRGLAPGDYVVRVAASGYSMSPEKPVHVPGTADFDLQKGARVYGTVRDRQSKQPLAGARVELDERLVVGGDAVPMIAGATTGSDGAFSIVGLGPDPQSLSAAAEGHHGRILSGLRATGGDVGPISIELTPTEPGEEPRIEFAGIGIMVGAQDDVLIIKGVVPGGGAAEAGLTAGDTILAVEGTPVGDLGFAGSMQAIRGPEDTIVNLTVRRGGQGSPQVVPVYRRRIRA